MESYDLHKEDYLISTDKSKLDIPVIHHFLAEESYWSRNVPIDIVKRAIEGSLCFGIYHHDRQVGFARVVSDFATMAYVADVFVINEYRGRGLSKWLMESILVYPRLQGLRRWVLATADAHGLYSQFGFKPVAKPERWMEIQTFIAYDPPQ